MQKSIVRIIFFALIVTLTITHISISAHAGDISDALSSNRDAFIGYDSGIEITSGSALKLEDIDNVMGDGAGTQDDPVLISTAEQLAELATIVNNGDLETLYEQETVHIMLTNNIDISAYKYESEWIPIGIDSRPFRGVFNGNGYYISGLNIRNAQSQYIGLFGVLSNNGEIKNLGVIDAFIFSGKTIGGIVGYVQSGTISNCYTTGSISAFASDVVVGGIVGLIETYTDSHASVINCYSSINISGGNSYGKVAFGGIAGGLTALERDSSISISNCHSTGGVISQGAGNVGGITGANSVLDGRIIISNNAALNQRLFDMGIVGRISGKKDGTYADNVSFAGIEIERKAEGEDGKSITASDINSEGFFETLYANDPNWKYETGKSPLLYVSGTQRLVAGQSSGDIWFNSYLPNAPYDVQATPNDRSITLTWSALDDWYYPVMKYQISCDDGYNWIDGTADKTFTFTDLINGNEYSFIVRAVNGIGESLPSVPVSATPEKPVKTISISEIAGIVAPCAGDAAVLEINETDEFTGSVSWQPALTADGKFNKGAVYTALIAITPKSGYTLRDIPADFFTINGVKATNGQDSGEISCTFNSTENPLPIPAENGLITVSDVTMNSLTLNWSKATDAVYSQDQLKYYVYQSESDNITGLTDILVNGTLLNLDGNLDIDTFGVTGLTENTTYYFNIVVEDELGNKVAYRTTSETTADKINQAVFTINGVGFFDTLVYGDTGKSVNTSGGSGNGEISYESDNDAVLSVGADGNITVHKAGIATITAIKSGDYAHKDAFDSISITVNKRALTISSVTLALKTFDGSKMGQVLNADIDGLIADDVLEFNLDYYAVAEYDSPNAGNRSAAITLALRETGATENYTFGDDNTFLLTNQTIRKAAGGAVSVPVVDGVPLQTTIAISPVIDVDGTAQIIEYAISQTDEETPISDWQTDTVFEFLTPNTTYYVYARTMENENYSTGVAQQSAAIMTAQMEPEKHLVIFSVTNGNGRLTASVDSVSLLSDDLVVDGKDIEFIAIPDANYTIKGWTDNGNVVNGTNTSYTISGITGIHTITVEFEPVLYAVSINSEGVNPSGDGQYQAGSEVYISSGSAPYGKRFINWTASSGDVAFDSAESEATSFIMPANNLTVMAVFGDIPPVVSGVVITPDIADVQKGTSCGFSAEVLGEHNPVQSVVWEVLGGTSETAITPNGLLTVSENETAVTLTIKATSTVDSNKFGIAVVDVIPPPPTVTSVDVFPSSISIMKGESYTFEAIVAGENEPSLEVNWSVVGGTPNTTISPQGILIIDENETAESLTVIATSQCDMSKMGTATIMVREIPPIIASVSNVKIMPDEISLKKGDTHTFNAVVAGENNPSQAVEWTVLGGSIMTTIDENGMLTIGTDEAAYTLTVKATSTVDSSKSSFATVNVIEMPQPLPTVTSVEVAPDAISLVQGGSHEFTAVVTGENNPPQSVEWSVMGGIDGTVITSGGELFIDPNETASILTVVATSSVDTEQSGTAMVTVTKDPSTFPSVSSVGVVPDVISVNRGDVYNFTATVIGDNNPGQSVAWSVIGGNGATSIDADGTLTIDINETSKTLMVQATSTVDSTKCGLATVTVTEIPPVNATVTSLIISPENINLYQGDSHRFGATVIGANNPPQSVIWSVLGGTDGTVIAADGTLTIGVSETADSLTVVATSAFDISKSGMAVVTVIKLLTLTPVVSDVDITPDAISLNRGDIYDFSVTVTGTNNPSQSVEWTVVGSGGNTTIDSSGKLTVDPDETAVTLTVKATSIVDSTKSCTATVTVLQPPTNPTIISVEVTPSAVTIEKGGNYAFSAHVSGDNNPPQSVVWGVLGGTTGTSIDDNGVLTVSDSETEEVLTITATSAYDDSKRGTAIVTVLQSLTVVAPQTPSVTIDPQTVTVYVGDRVNLSVTASVTDGGSLSYQWYKNSVSSSTGGTLIEGATSEEYTPPTGTVGVAYYYVEVTNAVAGTERSSVAATSVSNPVVLTVMNYSSSDNGNNGESGGNGDHNTDNESGQNDADNETIDTETAENDPPIQTIPILNDGKPSSATANDGGILEVAYSASDLKNNTDESGNCIIEITGHDEVYVTLPIPELNDGALTITTDFGIVTVPDETLQALRGLLGDDLRLLIKKGSFVFALVDAEGNEIIYNDLSNPFLIKLPYSLLDGQHSTSVVAVKKSSGNSVIIPVADYKDGYITFSVTSTGVYDTHYNPKTYTDTENHRKLDAISYVSARGLFSGTGNGAFSPDETMTRAMFLTVLARLAGTDLSQHTTSRFTDVPLNAWYADSVEWAASIGLVVGIGNDKFAPDDQITGEQIAVLLDRFIDILGYKLAPLPEVTSLSNNEYVSAWAVKAVRNIYQVGIIEAKADSAYEPQSLLTRAEAAEVFVRFIKAITNY